MASPPDVRVLTSHMLTSGNFAPDIGPWAHLGPRPEPTLSRQTRPMSQGRARAVGSPGLLSMRPKWIRCPGLSHHQPLPGCHSARAPKPALGPRKKGKEKTDQAANAVRVCVCARPGLEAAAVRRCSERDDTVQKHAPLGDSTGGKVAGGNVGGSAGLVRCPLQGSAVLEEAAVAQRAEGGDSRSETCSGLTLQSTSHFFISSPQFVLFTMLLTSCHHHMYLLLSGGLCTRELATCH